MGLRDLQEHTVLSVMHSVNATAEARACDLMLLIYPCTKLISSICTCKCKIKVIQHIFNLSILNYQDVNFALI